MFDIHIIGMLKCDAEVGMTELDFFMSTCLTRNHNKVLSFLSIFFTSSICSFNKTFLLSLLSLFTEQKI